MQSKKAAKEEGEKERAKAEVQSSPPGHRIVDQSTSLIDRVNTVTVCEGIVSCLFASILLCVRVMRSTRELDVLYLLFLLF